MKKLVKKPSAVLILLVLVWPLLWVTVTALSLASYSIGLTSHLGSSIGYFNSNKLSNFVSLPFDRINLSIGYGSRYLWVTEGSEIYISYSAENYGSEPVGFLISDYSTRAAVSEFELVKVEKSGAGIHRYNAKKSGLYKVSIFPPSRMIPAGQDVRYRYVMHWGVK